MQNLAQDKPHQQSLHRRPCKDDAPDKFKCYRPCLFSLRLYDEVPPSNFDTAAYTPLMSVLLHRSVCSALPLGRSIKQLMMTSKTKGYIRFYKSFVPNTFFLKRDLIFSVFCCIWQVFFDNFLVMVMFSPYSAALHMGYN